ncbi:hypothetical protein [Natrinema amylolyticum]|uniref:hypothetical protein n=1 Tax=Natrinema amylolyticum TaxID=2878679 RepID=UPI001CF984DA|nr:hypothetical protein [Natrinema amylolyticum]
MVSRMSPVKAAESTDQKVTAILRGAEEGLWMDPVMRGGAARRPQLFDSIVPAFEAIREGGRIDPELLRLLQLKTGEINRCTHYLLVRTNSVRDRVTSKEDRVFAGINERELARREVLGVRSAEKMVDDPNDTENDLREEFTDPEIVELVFANALFTLGDDCTSRMVMNTGEGSLNSTELESPLDHPQEILRNSGS